MGSYWSRHKGLGDFEGRQKKVGNATKENNRTKIIFPNEVNTVSMWVLIGASADIETKVYRLERRG